MTIKAVIRPGKHREPRNGTSVSALRARVKELEKERQRYAECLLMLTRRMLYMEEDLVRLTREEIRELDRSGVPLEEVIKEVKRLQSA